MPLFHPKVLKEGIERFAFPESLDSIRFKLVLPWIQRLRDGTLTRINERQLHGEFLQKFFGEVLGYRTVMTQGTGAWELSAEETAGGGGSLSMDGALGFFQAGEDGKPVGQVLVPIELKGAKQLLDQRLGRDRTPVEQAWNYANFTPECRWIIVSNYRETRLYSKARTPADYEEFRLEDLQRLEDFKRFFFLLTRRNLLPDTPEGQSRIDGLLAESAEKRAEITTVLYGEYHGLRLRLHQYIARKHSNLPPDTILALTQTILDRVIFMAFAEAKGLLPNGGLKHAATTRDPYRPHPLWDNLLSLFHWIDQGHSDRDERFRVPAYNGGLFRPVPELDELQLDDDMCRELASFTQYDFRVDVTEDVLGHIFEQSITDLERMRAQANGDAEEDAAPSKRKLEGVFYTPTFVTRYLVDETLGRLIEEKWAEALEAHRPGEATSPADEDARWQATWAAYREALKRIRVLDPACGSGAFLIAAFDRLASEYQRINEELSRATGGAQNEDPSLTILTNNLFGVDLNPESVEITRLSLWLKTARRGQKLTDLDRTIKCGNSVVSDPAFDLRAFDWARGKPVKDLAPDELTQAQRDTDALWRQGFDVVLGNPPYVRQERVARFKEHWEKASQVYSGTADLFVYFFERGLSVLKPGGRLGFVTNETWLKTASAEPLRAWLRTHHTVEALVSLGDNRVFADAPDVVPVLSILRNHPAPAGQATRAAVFRRGEAVTEFAKQLAERERPLTLANEPDSGWQLGGDAPRRLLDKLLAGGRPLGEVLGGGIYYGIKTGLNEAFIVDTSVRDALVQADPGCAPLLRKVFRGEDLRPWYQEDEGRWLIFARHGIDIDRYPSVKAHLEQFHEALEPRPADWPVNEVWKGRKPGAYRWCEIQDTIDYAREFDKPKIAWPDIAKYPRFSVAEAGSALLNTGYLAASSDPSLEAILQSRAVWYVIKQVSTPLNERAGLDRHRLFFQFMERLPIPDLDAESRAALADLAQCATQAARARYALEQDVRHRIHTDLVEVRAGVNLALELEAEAGARTRSAPRTPTLNQKLNQWWSLGFPAFQAEVMRCTGNPKLRKEGLPLPERGPWETWLRTQGREHARLTSELVAAETAINQRVFRLFGLTADEVKLIEDETRYKLGEG
jgi:hypothetical protein